MNVLPWKRMLASRCLAMDYFNCGRFPLVFGLPVSASCPIIALLSPHSLGVTGFQADLLQLQQNCKDKVDHILAYLPRLDTAMSPSGKSGHASQNNMDYFQVVI
jgi:hypothetical protein